MADPADVARFTALYDAYYPRVYAYAVSRAGHQAAEDVAGETFCVAWRRLADLPDPPVAWLLGIARNVLRASYRDRTRRDALAAALRAWSTPADLTGTDVGEQVVERSEVLRALATLSDRDRELLTLTAWHGLSAAEAADVLGCSKAAYFVRLHRARTRLARALAGAPAPVAVSAPTPDPSEEVTR